MGAGDAQTRGVATAAMANVFSSVIILEASTDGRSETLEETSEGNDLERVWCDEEA